MDLMRQGGWDMWLLLLISIVGLRSSSNVCSSSRRSTATRRGCCARWAEVAGNDLTARCRSVRKNKRHASAHSRVRPSRGEKNRADITDALSIALMEHLNSLERNLAIIGTIAVIAPFVGLFGTVLGIIRAFQDIALKGNSTPAVVAAGVSEALITTAAGLFVAVISVIFFNFFKSRIKKYNQEMIVAANQLAEMLHFHNTGCADPDRSLSASQGRR